MSPYRPTGRQHWSERLSLPTLLTVHTHGLVEGQVATFGFVIWDVGENRQLMEHGAKLGQGPQIGPTTAAYGALIAAFDWLIEQEQHRRRIHAFTDNMLVYQQLLGQQPVKDRTHWPLVRQAQRALRLSPQLALRLCAEQDNQRAITLASRAYVSVQEASRLQRAAEVLPELVKLGPDRYAVGNRYRVDLAAGTCTCPDFRRVHSEKYPIRCKHLLAALQLANKR